MARPAKAAATMNERILIDWFDVEVVGYEAEEETEGWKAREVAKSDW